MALGKCCTIAAATLVYLSFTSASVPSSSLARWASDTAGSSSQPPVKVQSPRSTTCSNTLYSKGSQEAERIAQRGSGIQMPSPALAQIPQPGITPQECFHFSLCCCSQQPRPALLSHSPPLTYCTSPLTGSTLTRTGTWLRFSLLCSPHPHQHKHTPSLHTLCLAACHHTQHTTLC